MSRVAQAAARDQSGPEVGAATATPGQAAGTPSPSPTAAPTSGTPGAPRAGEAFSFALEEPGEYSGLSTRHPSMTGTIVVA